jgi:enoyl-CoA hydratase/carnithine racemase
MTAQLKSTSQGQTLILTLSNPALRNALTTDICAAGIEALNVAETNPDIRSVVITGDGANFCAGSDVQRFQRQIHQSAQVQAQMVESVHSWMEAVRTCPKPVIAAVEGACVGAGFALSLVCDMIVAAADSVFMSGFSNLALSPYGGASWNLAQSLPRQIGMELLLLDERISASRLHGLGMVNRISDRGHALGEALTLAERLNARAPNAVSSIKELMNDAPTQHLTHHLSDERQAFVKNLLHPNARSGIDAFLSKQTPTYK